MLIGGSFFHFRKDDEFMKKTPNKSRTISSFTGEYAFLSNLYPAPISYMGLTYANNEAAFQAQKTFCVGEQMQFSIFRLQSPAEAKKLGRRLSLRPDWNRVKIPIMYEICLCKFMQNPKLRQALLDTGNSYLVHDCPWSDYFWDRVNGRGKNHFGQILMDIRAKLRWEAETERG